MNSLTVTAIIPNWNGRRFLSSLLKQIELQTYPVSEVLLIDNGSTDDSRELAAAAGCRVIKFGSNRGFAAAVNEGVRHSAGELCLILNNDVELDATYVDRSIAEIKLGADFATGRIRMAGLRENLDATFDLVARSGCAWRCGHGGADRLPWTEGRKIQIAPMTALLVRRRIFNHVGGLDERFGSYLEDVDFGLGCASLGYMGRYVPAAVGYHVGSGTRGPWHAETVRQIARNQLLLVAKWQGARRWRENGWQIAVGQILWGLLAARHGRSIAWLRGKIDGIRLFRHFEAEGDEVVRRWLVESEAQIAALQAQAGWQPYWRWYFRLVGTGKN